MGKMRMPTPVRKKNKDGSDKSDVWWLRKKVPDRFRALVGRQEVWRSLDTTDWRAATIACVKLGDALDKEWAARLRAAEAVGRVPAPKGMTPYELSGLQRLAHEQTRDTHIENPPPRYAWGADLGVRSEEADLEEREHDEAALNEFLTRNGFEATESDRRRFLPLFLEARREGRRDLYRAAQEKPDYSESSKLKDYAPSPAHKIDFLDAFEFYCEKSGIKGGPKGETARRWRPKIRAFCEFVGHTDLQRMTTDDGYRWMDKLVEEGVAKKSVRDVWIASLKAVAGYIVERRKLSANPFVGIRVRHAKGTKGSNKKGFSDAQAATILEATLSVASDLTIPETRAARRWVPWICAYTGARVNEITSLLVSDVREDPETGIYCFYLRPEVTKGDYERVVPLHSHLLEQGLLDYVETRRALGLPLFYDPSRAEGGEDARPQWQKVANRLGDWVRESLKITGVAPNHAWRHRFKSVARHVHMHPEVEKFITGHGGSDDREVVEKVSMAYGDAWVKTLKKTIEMYPRYEIAALGRPPEPRKRTRRTPAQIVADKQSKAASSRRRPAFASERTV